MKVELWGEIQQKIQQLSDDDLEELFEVGHTVKKLENDKTRMTGVIKNYDKQFELLKESSTIVANINSNKL